jgi:hypothetical protein
MAVAPLASGKEPSMVIETPVADLTWRLLWSHTAQQVITDIAHEHGGNPVAAGYGWGLRSARDPRCALLVHPTAVGRDAGDLSLTVLGAGTHVIPRADLPYPIYISLVQEAVEAAAQTYLN